MEDCSSSQSTQHMVGHLVKGNYFKIFTRLYLYQTTFSLNAGVKKYRNILNWAEPSMDGSSIHTSRSTAADRRFYLKLAQKSDGCDN